MRAHSKFAASASDRWFACPGSVELSEGIPDKGNVYSEEGTHAHKGLELHLKCYLSGNAEPYLTEYQKWHNNAPPEMTMHVLNAYRFILRQASKTPNALLCAEERICLPFLHKDAFGTYDAAIVEDFGTLHVMDFKYGAGVGVQPKENLQLIFYAMGVAAKYDWNFLNVSLWIIQPRHKNYQSPVSWTLPIDELYGYVDVFKKAVDRVLNESKTYVEGSHCHWCKAKSVCPLKTNRKYEKADSFFAAPPKFNCDFDSPGVTFPNRNK